MDQAEFDQAERAELRYEKAKRPRRRVPELGVIWAAKGDIRSRNLRKPLAWVDGFRGGVLFVATGGAGPANGSHWLTMPEWEAWVSETQAAPYTPDVDADPLGEPA